jgi:LuxR family maltose regulon positive regulatory protein
MARPHLLTRLHAGLDHPLILLSAAAGSGKTTLLSCWLEATELPSVWISLDERDDDLVVFLTSFIAAVQKLFPHVGEESLALVHAPHAPPFDYLVNTLIRELAQIEEPFIVVLDDYHHVHQRAIHDVLDQILRHPPSALHLVISTRRDPPLPLPTLLARHQMMELRTHDLLFTTEEAAAFVQSIADVEMDSRAIAFLVEQTEGWVTGLRLTGFALRNHGDWARVVAGLQGNSRYISEYLTQEVLATQPPAVQTFLLQTAIFDRFCGALCDAVVDLGESDANGQDVIEQLEHANLFLVALDDEKQWYRYQHLFHHLLRHELNRHYSPADIAALHTRASGWFAHMGMLDDALTHAFAADNLPLAVQLVTQHRYELLNREEYRRLRKWLDKFPVRIIETEPELLVLQAWLDIGTWPIAERLARLDRVEAMVGDHAADAQQFTRLRGELDVLRAGEYRLQESPTRNAFHAARALETIPSHVYAARILARVYLGGAQLRMGELDAVHRTLQAGFQEEAARELPYRMRMLMAASFLHWQTADVHRLTQHANYILRLQDEVDMPESHGWVRTFLGHVCYLQNDLAAAEEQYATVSRQRYKMPKYCVIESAYGLALIHQARGDMQRADEELDAAAAYALEIGSTFLQPLMPFYQAALALRQGQVAAATRWMEEVDDLPLANAHALSLCIPLLIRPKLLVAQDTAASRRRAAALLAPLAQLGKRTHNLRLQSEVLIVRALLHAAAGEQADALSAMEEAVHQVEPTGYVRIFADHGPRVATLLRQLSGRGVESPFLTHILAASPPTAASAAATQRLALIEPLTTRELEILELLAQRRSNKEIAQELIISTETVRKHASNLYQKLHVRGRRQAVDQAIALGILTQSPIDRPG